MKIAIFTDTFIPQINGVVTATLNLAKGLAGRGHKVLIVAPKFNSKKEFRYKNIKVVRLPSIPAYFYEDFRFTSPLSWGIINLLKKEKIDVVHFQVPMPLAMQAIVAAKTLGIPIVGTFHTFFGDPAYLKHAHLDFKLIERLSWIYSSAFYNRCDLITAPSETTKQELLSNGFNKNIKVISNGIDFSIFDNEAWKKVKDKYNKKGEILLFIGRVAHEKNIFYLLDVFKLVNDKIPNTKLLIVGDGPQMNKVKSKIKLLKLENKVILIGRIDHAKLVRSSIFGASKIFVTASKTENQPMTLLEAQANGLVCVGLNERGLKTLIKNDYNGYLVKDNDKMGFARKIEYLIKNKVVYNKMKENTLKEIKKHSLKEVVKEWEKEYHLLISSK